MKSWVKVYHFLGSMRFTIMLFAALVLLVAIGTCIESMTGSHESASNYVYRHPLFLFLLAAVFLNLLLAAFRKLPWRVKHVPFLLAHLGLLMVIAGAYVNAFFGYSGVMVLADNIPQKVLIPGTFALCIEGRNGSSMVSMGRGVSAASLNVNKPLFAIDGLQGSVLKSASHSRQKLKCSHENQIFLCSMENKSSFQQLRLSDSARSAPFVLGNDRWQASAIKGGYVGEHVVALIDKQKREKAPVLSFIQDENLDEYLVMIGKNGSVEVSSIESLLKQSLVSFDDGAKGYGVEAKVPTEMGGGAIYLKVWPSAEQLAPLAKMEENIPSVYLCFSDAGHSEIVSLTYDPTATSLMWPLFEGQYLVRYQPMEHALPFVLKNKEWSCRHAEHFPHNEDCLLKLDLVDSKGSVEHLSIGYNAPFTTKGLQLTLLKNPAGEKQVRIGVQNSFSKKTLIYPGVFCAALGILFLYIKKLVSVEFDSTCSHAASAARPASCKRK